MAAPVKTESPVIEEPVEELVKELVEEPVEEPVEAPKVSDTFNLEEIAAMQQLADMGRFLNDEDEARMVKLTEDITAWINKYAPTFDDPEKLLFEVTTPLISDELAA